MRGANNLHSDWLGQDVGPYASNSDSTCKGWCEGIWLKGLANWLVVKGLYRFGELATKGRKKATKCGKRPYI